MSGRSKVRLNQTQHIRNTRNLSTCLWQIIPSVRPAYTAPPSGLYYRSRVQKTTLLFSADKVGKSCLLHFDTKEGFLSLVMRSILIVFWYQTQQLWNSIWIQALVSCVQTVAIISVYVLHLADCLCCAWFISLFVLVPRNRYKLH
jgi:hypothetical protein